MTTQHGGRPMTMREIMDAEEPSQPVLEVRCFGEKRVFVTLVPVEKFNDGDRLYTAPQPRQWQGLTDEEIALFINGRGDEDDDDYVEPTGDGFGLTDEDLVRLARRAEAKLREKNHG